MPAAVDGLNRSQRAAVTHPGGPLLVSGGAGTGKTKTLARRLAWLAEHGADPGGLLLLCHSATAAADMRVALEELVRPPYEELHVHTFRSFCERLLRDESEEAALDPSFATVSAADRVALLLDHLPDLNLRHHELRGNPAPLLAGFVSRIDRLKAEMVSSEALLDHAASVAEAAEDAGDAARSAAARELEFARLYADHDRLLAARGTLDSGDLVIAAFRLLHEKPHVRKRTADRFGHVLVDDLQDAGFAEATLLALIATEHGQISAAADARQATSRLRGPAAKNLDDLRRAFEGLTEVRLGETRRGRKIRFWRCASERAQAQAVAAECERLIGEGVSAAGIAVLVPSLAEDGPGVAAALEERAVPARMTGSAAYFQRAEVRDVLAWLRMLADPGDSGAAVRALSRPPVGLHSVDIARLTQLARRRKLDMPGAVSAALDGPQLTPEGRDRAQAFLRLYRAAAAAFEDRRPDAFVLRLIERIGIRRQQVFATQADTVERLRNVARLPELASAFMRREPGATPRDFARYLKAVADSGLPQDEAPSPPASPAVEILTPRAAKGREFARVFAVGLDATRMPGRDPGPVALGAPEELLPERVTEDPDAHRARMGRLLHVAVTRARDEAVIAWPEQRDGTAVRRSPLVEELRGEMRADEEAFEEELFGPGEGLHSTFRIMRDELLDTVSRVAGSLGEMRLDTGVDVSNAVARFLELVKVAAVIERTKAGQPVDSSVEEVNALLSQGATAEQREILAGSPLDDWLRDAGRDPARLPGASETEPSLDPFIPRRGDGLMLSASDIETYRLCPLKYKFARVFRIPQEATIHQRFGIALHQVLERFHQHGQGSREELLELFEASWRRGGFGDSDDDLQFRERAIEALERYWERSRADEGEPVWFERSFSFRLGDHLLRGRVDRVDRRPDGSYELIDYKTGRAKTEEQLREDVQLSLYQMGARESWRLETAAQSYLYVMTGEKVPVEHSQEQLDRVRSTVAEIGEGILRHDFRPTPDPEICSFCDYRIICPAAER